MKKYVAISLGLFVTIIAIVFAATLINQQDTDVSVNSAEETNIDITTDKDANSLESDNSTTTSTTKTYSTQAVSTHNTAKDCWMIIENKVYDFTSYAIQHPDGPQSIIKYCGQDGTTGFVTKDKRRAQDHSSQAYDMLKDYYLGDLQ